MVWLGLLVCLVFFKEKCCGVRGKGSNRVKAEMADV